MYQQVSWEEKFLAVGMTDLVLWSVSWTVQPAGSYSAIAKVVLHLGPGRLCLKHHLLFYSFIPLKWAYNSFKVAYYSQVLHSTGAEYWNWITCPEIISHNGPQGYSQACSPLYCLLLYCTLYNCVHVLKLTCNLAYYSHSSGKMCLLFQYNSHQNREPIMLKIMLA